MKSRPTCNMSESLSTLRTALSDLRNDSPQTNQRPNLHASVPFPPVEQGQQYSAGPLVVATQIRRTELESEEMERIRQAEIVQQEIAKRQRTEVVRLEQEIRQQRELERQEEERRRQAEIVRVEEERRQQGELKRQEEERRRQAEIVRLEEDRRQQGELERQEEERRWQADIVRLEAERRQQGELERQEEERRRQAEILRLEDERRHQRELEWQEAELARIHGERSHHTNNSGNYGVFNEEAFEYPGNGNAAIPTGLHEHLIAPTVNNALITQLLQSIQDAQRNHHQFCVNQFRHTNSRIDKLTELVERDPEFPIQPDSLPMTTRQNIEEFETGSDEKFRKVVQYLAELGGFNLNETANFIVKNAIEDSLAPFLTWQGREPGTMKLQDTRLAKSFYAAETKNRAFPKPTIKEFTDAMTSA